MTSGITFGGVALDKYLELIKEREPENYDRAKVILSNLLKMELNGTAFVKGVKQKDFEESGLTLDKYVEKVKKEN